MQQLSTYLLCILLLISTSATLLQAQQGWHQTDGSPRRNRYTDQPGTISTVNKLHPVNLNLQTLVLHKSSKRSYAISVDEQKGTESLVRFNTDGSLTTIGTAPQQYVLDSLLDDQENYYTLRTNFTYEQMILRTSPQGVNQVVYRGKQVDDMVLTSGNNLIVSDGQNLISVDVNKGTTLWKTFIPKNGQDLIAVENDLLIDGNDLFVSTFDFTFIKVDVKTGKIVANEILIYDIPFFAQFTFGSKYVAVIQKKLKISIYELKVFKKDTLELVLFKTVYGNEGYLNLFMCSNIIGSETDSFATVCLESTGYTAYRFDVNSNSLSIGYGIPLSDVLSSAPSVCSKTISTINKSMFAVVCDTGVAAFSFDNKKVLRKDVNTISVGEETRVFGSLDRLMIYSPVGYNSTQLQYV